MCVYCEHFSYDSLFCPDCNKIFIICPVCNRTDGDCEHCLGLGFVRRENGSLT